MKKVLFTVAIVAAAALGMTSCSNKEKCWKINATTTIAGVTTTTDTYFWGTKNQRDDTIDKAKAAAKEDGCEYKVNSKKSVKAEDSADCLKKNVNL